jgi:hypothetical protein
LPDWAAKPGIDETPPSSKGFQHSVPSDPPLGEPAREATPTSPPPSAVEKTATPAPAADSTASKSATTRLADILGKLLFKLAGVIVGCELIFLFWHGGRRYRLVLYGVMLTFVVLFVAVGFVRAYRRGAASSTDDLAAAANPAKPPGGFVDPAYDEGEILRADVGGERYICDNGPYKIYDFFEDGRVKTWNENNGELSSGPSYHWVLRGARLVLLNGETRFRTYSLVSRHPGLITIRGDDGVAMRCETSRSPLLGQGKL